MTLWKSKLSPTADEKVTFWRIFYPVNQKLTSNLVNLPSAYTLFLRKISFAFFKDEKKPSENSLQKAIYSGALLIHMNNDKEMNYGN